MEPVADRRRKKGEVCDRPGGRKLNSEHLEAGGDLSLSWLRSRKMTTCTEGSNVSIECFSNDKVRLRCLMSPVKWEPQRRPMSLPGNVHSCRASITRKGLTRLCRRGIAAEGRSAQVRLVLGSRRSSPAALG